MVRSWLRVSARAGSAGAQVVRLLDNRDGPQPITGIKRVSTRLRVLRKGKNSGDMTTMTDFTGEVHGRSLVLRGTCVTCRGRVARGEREEVS